MWSINAIQYMHLFAKAFPGSRTVSREKLSLWGICSFEHALWKLEDAKRRLCFVFVYLPSQCQPFITTSKVIFQVQQFLEISVTTKDLHSIRKGIVTHLGSVSWGIWAEGRWGYLVQSGLWSQPETAHADKQLSIGQWSEEKPSLTHPHLLHTP